MDTETIKFITGENRELRKELKKDLKEIIGPVMDEVKIIKRETRVSRWAHRNPKVAIITVVILIASVSIGLHTVGVKRAVDRLMRIEIKD